MTDKFQWGQKWRHSDKVPVSNWLENAFSLGFYSATIMAGYGGGDEEALQSRRRAD
jgi:hypothetical protein